MGRVLVIDDDAGVRESFALPWRTPGTRSRRPKAVLREIESARASRPDLAFLDLKMPGLSGVETLAALHASCPGMPVYIVTAFYGDYLIPLRDLESRGVDFNLARKPLTVREIQMIAASRLGDEIPADGGATRHPASKNWSALS